MTGPAPETSRLHDLPLAAIEALAAEARSEGYRFLDRLIDEWQTGRARFDGPGEQLLGVMDNGSPIAVGGLHRDAYANEPRTGRLRRVYVAPAWRRRGVARSLVRALLVGAELHYDRVRLRTPDAAAAGFYAALGFAPITEPEASHVLRLT